MADFHPPGYIMDVLRTLEDAGHAAYLVGGCVRDAALGKQPKDWDIATSALVEETARLFPKTVLTGARYGTVTVLLPECAVEVTTFRADGEYRDSRRPESVEFVSALPADLARRDFTMNAMAVSRTGELIDPYGGERDIAARVIRCVGDPERRFGEDALRMLRALRFSAELGFAIEPETLLAIKRLAPLSRALSAERVRDEVQRTLMSDCPEIMGDMIKYGLLADYVNDSGEKPENFSKIKVLPRSAAVRWCALCTILLGAGRIGSATDFTKKMRLDNRTAGMCAAGAELALCGIPAGAADIKRVIAARGAQATEIAAEVYEALRGERRTDAVRAVLHSGECCTVRDLAVTGRDLISLGFPSGPQIGAELGRLLEHVMEHPADNRREVLMKRISDIS